MGSGDRSSLSGCVGAVVEDGCWPLPGDVENVCDILENHEPLRCGGVAFGLPLLSSLDGFLECPAARDWGIGLAAGKLELSWGEAGGEAGAALPLILLGVVDCSGRLVGVEWS